MAAAVHGGNDRLNEDPLRALAAALPVSASVLGDYYDNGGGGDEAGRPMEANRPVETKLLVYFDPLADTPAEVGPAQLCFTRRGTEYAAFSLDAVRLKTLSAMNCTLYTHRDADTLQTAERILGAWNLFGSCERGVISSRSSVSDVQLLVHSAAGRAGL
jgi:hypothetical protein